MVLHLFYFEAICEKTEEIKQSNPSPQNIELRKKKKKALVDTDKGSPIPSLGAE